MYYGSPKGKHIKRKRENMLKVSQVFELCWIEEICFYWISSNDLFENCEQIKLIVLYFFSLCFELGIRWIYARKLWGRMLLCI